MPANIAFDPGELDDDYDYDELSTHATLVGAETSGTPSPASSPPPDCAEKGLVWDGGSHECVQGLSYWGGPVVANLTVHPVFWGANWSSPEYAGDRIEGALALYSTMSNSSYVRVLDQYLFSATAASVAMAPPAFVNDSDPHAAFLRGGDAFLQGLVDIACELADAAPDVSDYFAVHVDFTDTSADYCGFHTYGWCWSVPDEAYLAVSFGAVLDGGAGCNAYWIPSPRWSAETTGMTVTAAHEVAETMTDVHLSAWYQNNVTHNEVADMCAWRLGVVELAGEPWLLQSFWDNEYGCIYGEEPHTVAPTSQPSVVPPPSGGAGKPLTGSPTSETASSRPTRATGSPTSRRPTTLHPTSRSPTRRPTTPRPTRRPVTRSPTHPSKSPTPRPTSERPTRRP